MNESAGSARKRKTAGGSSKKSTGVSSKKTAPKKTTSRQGVFGRKTVKPSRIKFQKVLVPIDFSDRSRQVLCDALGLAQQFNSKLVLLHVVEPVIYPADLGYAPVDVRATGVDLRDTALARLQELCTNQIPVGIQAEAHVRVGQAYKEITDAAREWKVDLMVISTHGYTGLTHVFLGSTAERVVRHAPCPVLTVRKSVSSK